MNRKVLGSSAQENCGQSNPEEKNIRSVPKSSVQPATQLTKYKKDANCQTARTQDQMPTSAKGKDSQQPGAKENGSSQSTRRTVKCQPEEDADVVYSRAGTVMPSCKEQDSGRITRGALRDSVRAKRRLRRESAEKEQEQSTHNASPTSKKSVAASPSAQASDEAITPGVYYVEAIHSFNGCEYFVKWVDWPSATNTWEIPENLLGASQAVTDYHKRMGIRHAILSQVLMDKRLKDTELKYISFLKEGTIPYKVETQYWKMAALELELNDLLEKNGQSKLLIECWSTNQSTSPNYFREAYESLLSFKYTLECEAVGLMLRQTSICDLGGCSCATTHCKKCNCSRTELGDAYYDDNGCLSRGVMERNEAVVECSSACACVPATCANRIVQRGRQVLVVLFRDPQKGWTLRAGETIPRGRLVAVFMGEILSREDAEKRASTSYQFELMSVADEQQVFVLDTKYVGNEARFISHSCQGNCRAIHVLTNRYGDRCLEVGIFAERDIKVGEELSFDYYHAKSKEELGMVAGKTGIECACGTKTCRKYLF